MSTVIVIGLCAKPLRKNNIANQTDGRIKKKIVISFLRKSINDSDIDNSVIDSFERIGIVQNKKKYYVML